MITTVDEVNSDKTKVPEEFFFLMFCLIVSLPNSSSAVKQSSKTLGKKFFRYLLYPLKSPGLGVMSFK